jgi:hypothetical protein
MEVIFGIWVWSLAFLLRFAFTAAFRYTWRDR